MVLIGTLALLTLESVLLEIKYQIFSGGGFLQSKPLTTVSDKAAFMALFIAAFLLLRHLALLPLRAIIKRLPVSPGRADFYANAVFIFGYGVTLMALYKLHSYVADHVDHTVINAIAGGKLSSALAYVKDELVIFGLPIVLYVLCIWLFAKRIPKAATSSAGTRDRWLPLPVIVSLLIIIGMAFMAASNIQMNGRRTVAYNALNIAAEYLTDFDLDGSSSFSTPSDPAPFDGSIFWGATDLPDNGIDENGLGGDLKLATETPAPALPGITLPAGYKHLMIIVSESTRADILNKEIDGQFVAPHLRELAASGSVAPQAFSHAGFTSNSLYTLFAAHYRTRADTPSLFELATSHGFEVNIFSGQDESWGDLDTRLKTRENATIFYDPQEDPDERVFPSKLPSSIKLAGETLKDKFVSSLPGIDQTKRQLFYFNFQAAHFPYFHSRMTRRFTDEGIPRDQINQSNQKWLERTYWNALSYMDQNLGGVIEALKARDMLKDTLIVFIGDHGESLFHKGFLGHGHDLNRDQLQIPMVFSAPGLTFDAPVGLIDLAAWLQAFVTTPEGEAVSFARSSPCVLMYTGRFRRPVQIGRICKDQSTIDVYTIPFDEVQSTSGMPREAVKNNLIHAWEKAHYLNEAPLAPDGSAR